MRFRTDTYTRTQQSLPPLWVASTFTHEKKNNLLENVCENIILQILSRRLIVARPSTRDLSLKLQSWGNVLPLCFTTNKVHYARHGTYHIQHLKQLDNFHPGTFEEIESFASERRKNYGITQAVDRAGEQIYMRNAKTTRMQVH